MKIPPNVEIPIEKLTHYLLLPRTRIEATPEARTLIPLYEQVALTRDFDEHGLRRGDVATLIDRVPHPVAGEPGVVLEIFNALGESLKTVAVGESDIEPLQRDEVLAVRSLVNAR